LAELKSMLRVDGRRYLPDVIWLTLLPV
jgi:hypothetical protein